MSGTPNRRQHRYRFRTDAGGVDATPTWGANEDTTYAAPAGVNVRVRFLIWNDGTATTGNQSWGLYVQKNGTGSFTAVTTTSSVVKAVDASSSADNTSLATQRLTSPASGSFVNGQYDETGATGNIAITTGNFSEFEYGIQFVAADLAAGDYVKLRVYAGGVALQAYDVEPQVYPTLPATITSPAANITLAGLAPSVSSGASVASPVATITVAGRAPVVASGAAVVVPAASITVAAVAPRAVGPPIPGTFDSGIFDTGIFDHREAGGTGVEIVAPLSTITLAALAPSVASGASVTIPAADITLAGVAPSVVSGASVTVPVADLAVAGLAPSVVSGASVAVPAVDITLAGLAPEVASGASISVPAKNIDVEGKAPNIIVGGGIIVPAAEIEVAGLAPSIASGASVAVPVTDIVFAANAPAVSVGVGIAVPAANLVLSGFAPTIIAGGGDVPADAGRDGGTNDDANNRARLNRLQARAALLAKQAEELAQKDKPKAKAVKAAAKKVVETLEAAKEAGGALLSDEYIVMLDQLIVGLRIDFLGPSIDPAKAALLALQAQAAAAVVNELRLLQQDEEDAIAALLMVA